MEFLPYAESMELIRIVNWMPPRNPVGWGMAAIRDLASVVKINFVPIPEDVVKKSATRLISPGVIPPFHLTDKLKPVPTATITNILVTRAAFPMSWPIKMTKLMFDNLDRLVTAHAAAKGHFVGQGAEKPAVTAASGCRAVLQGKRAVA